MSDLISNNNVSMDGMRDLYNPNPDSTSNGGTGSVSLNRNLHRNRFPRQNGGARNSTMINQGGAVPPNYQPNTANDGDDAYQFADTRGSIRAYKGNAGSDRYSNTVTSFKGSTTTVWNGWGTGGAYQAVTNNLNSTARGNIMTGSSTITTSAIPFTDFNSSFDSNKWLCGIITKKEGLFTYTSYLVFEGSGASTSDTDWTSFWNTFADRNNGSGVQAANPPTSTPNGSGFPYGIGSTETTRASASSVYVSYSRVVYEFSGKLFSSDFDLYESSAGRNGNYYSFL